MASRALMQRLSSASSNWPGSTRTGARSGARSCSMRISPPRVRLNRSSIPWTSPFASTGRRSRSRCRLKESSLCVSPEPRSAAAMALRSCRCWRDPSGAVRSASCRLPRIAVSRLLKSCATPPAMVPSACILSAWRSRASRFRRSVISCSMVTRKAGASWRITGTRLTANHRVSPSWRSSSTASAEPRPCKASVSIRVSASAASEGRNSCSRRPRLSATLRPIDSALAAFSRTKRPCASLKERRPGELSSSPCSRLRSVSRARARAQRSCALPTSPRSATGSQGLGE